MSLPKRTKAPLRAISGLFAALLLIAVACPASAKTAPKATAKAIAVVVTPSGSHLVGNPHAPVRLVEYISYTCPHCAAFEAESAAPLRASYITTGNVSLEVRHWPRDPIDLTAAALAACAEPRQFLGLHHALMQAQPKLAGVSIEQLRHWGTMDARAAAHEIAAATQLYAIGAGFGVDRAKADRCFADTALLRRIAVQGEDGSKQGVKGTPTFFLNDMRIYDTVTWAMLAPQIAARLP